MAGPLDGLRVLEISGIGPALFGGMLLADMGAQVLRITRPATRQDGGVPDAPNPPDMANMLARNRHTLTLDLHAPEAVAAVLDLVEQSDVLLEGFRPGVMERLGLGPAECLARNPQLVYGRMTGWGQHGPLARAAGHDINFVALSGALHAIGCTDETPTPPHSFTGEFGSGGMLLAFGVLCALHEAAASKRGQVVDAAMTDGAALLSAMVYGLRGAGCANSLGKRNAETVYDGSAPFYDTYACADGKFVAIGAIESRFFAELRERCGIQDETFDDHLDGKRWPLMKLRLADVFRTRTRDEWCTLLEGTDACFAPVLDWNEAPRHPHNRARETFVMVGDMVQPAPAPRFSRTPAAMPRPAEPAAVDQLLQRWGADETLLARLRSAATLATSTV